MCPQTSTSSLDGTLLVSSESQPVESLLRPTMRESLSHPTAGIGASTLSSALNRNLPEENAQVGHHNAQYALAALRAEVNQLAAKAFCTATATEAARNAHIRRTQDLVLTQTALLATRRRIASLDTEISNLNSSIEELEVGKAQHQSCIENAQSIMQDLCNSIEFKVSLVLQQLGLKA